MTLFCAALLLLASLCHARETPQVRTGVVSRVVDGDTLWINSNGVLLKVRIIGMDAPEICQSGGHEARDILRRRAAGRVVTITYRHLDNYGRVLGTVEHDGDDLGRWMVRLGHAWSDGYRNYPGPYAAEQQAAMSARLGLFALELPELPRKFRQRHGSCFP